MLRVLCSYRLLSEVLFRLLFKSDVHSLKTIEGGDYHHTCSPHSKERNGAFISVVRQADWGWRGREESYVVKVFLLVFSKQLSGRSLLVFKN